MRQVFSSARIENVQAVAKLLADEGIEVRVEDGQRYRRSIRSGFSYRESGGNASRASVWVVRSDDQPRARQLLHAAGLLEATPANPASFLPRSGHAARAVAPKRRAQVGLGVFLVAAVALALWLNQFRNPGWDLPTPATRTAPMPLIVAAGDRHGRRRAPHPDSTRPRGNGRAGRAGARAWRSAVPVGGRAGRGRGHAGRCAPSRPGCCARVRMSRSGRCAARGRVRLPHRRLGRRHDRAGRSPWRRRTGRPAARRPPRGRCLAGRRYTLSGHIGRRRASRHEAN